MAQAKKISGLSILFVDDEEKSLKYFQRAFSGDFNVLTASCANEAENILEQEGDSIAVLITDQRMPERTGIQLLHAAKNKRPHTIRMLTTAYSDLENTIDAVNNVGIFRYISKPWSIDDLADSLKHAVELYVRQKRMHDLMEERKKTMLSLASNIAHELRISMLKIGGTSWELDANLPTLLAAYEQVVSTNNSSRIIDETHYRNLKQASSLISREVERGNAVIDMLLMNAADHEQHALLSDKHKISDIIIAALNDYPFQEGERQLVNFDAQGDFLFYGPQTLMRHVIFNLINNSLYAIGRLNHGEVSISPGFEGSMNLLRFRDTGGGIAEIDIPFIFDDFYTSKASITNTGLGLAFCKKVMRSLGGDITCHSKRNEYTEFVLKFPVIVKNSV